MIVSLAEGHQGQGRGPRTSSCHATDIVPTIYDCLGVELPEVVKGYTQIPLEGMSFKYSSTSDDAPTQKETGFFVDARLARHLAQGLEGRHASTRRSPAGATSTRIAGSSTTPTRTGPRCHDLAAEHPEKLQELIDLWFHEAGKYIGLPLDDRTAVEVLTDPTRPQMAKPRDRYIYYPDAPRCRRRPRSTSATARYTIAAEVTSTRPKPTACCSRTAPLRRARAVRQGRQAQVRLQLRGRSSEQIVESTKEVPTGQVRALGARSCAKATTCRRTGTLTLYINDEQVGEGTDHDPARQLLARRRGPERRHAIRASRSRTTTRATRPCAFTGGTIKQVDRRRLRRAVRRPRARGARDDGPRMMFGELRSAGSAPPLALPGHGLDPGGTFLMGSDGLLPRGAAGPPRRRSTASGSTSTRSPSPSSAAS